MGAPDRGRGGYDPNILRDMHACKAHSDTQWAVKLTGTNENVFKTEYKLTGSRTTHTMDEGDRRALSLH